MSFNAEIISLILQGLKYVPEFVEVGKDVWKKLKPPAKLAADGAQMESEKTLTTLEITSFKFRYLMIAGVSGSLRQSLLHP